MHVIWHVQNVCNACMGWHAWAGVHAMSQYRMIMGYGDMVIWGACTAMAIWHAGMQIVLVSTHLTEIHQAKPKTQSGACADPMLFHPQHLLKWHMLARAEINRYKPWLFCQIEGHRHARALPSTPLERSVWAQCFQTGGRSLARFAQKTF